MRCWRVGTREEREASPPVSLAQVSDLNVRLEQLEDMRAGVGPQFNSAQIQGFIRQTRSAAVALNERSKLSSSERKEFDRLRLNLHAAIARYPGRRAVIQRELSAEEKRRFKAKIFALRCNPKVCPDERHREAMPKTDRRKVDYVCGHYPAYVRELLYNEKACETFFKWALRSGCSVDAFVQFPRTAKELKSCHADKRFGAIFGNNAADPGLRVRDGMLEMKVDGGIAGVGVHEGSSYVPIHDRDLRIALTNLVNRTASPYIVTVGEIFRQLKAKTTGYENVEVLADGVSNWNTIESGSFNPDIGEVERFTIPGTDAADRDLENWIRKYPPSSFVTAQDIQDRFPDQTVEGEGVKWALCMSRQFPDTKMGPRVDNTHVFMTLFVPNGDGRFRELCLGLQPDFLPKGFLHKLWLVGSTELAKVHFNDESRHLIGDMKEGGFRSHRGLIYNLTKAETATMNRFVAYEMQKGFDGHKIFSAQGNNCANWVQKAFWKLFVDPLLFTPLRVIAASHENANFKAYVDALERATKASNDPALEKYISRVIVNLDRPQIIAFIEGCHVLLRRTLYKDHLEDLPALDRACLREARMDLFSREAQKLLKATLESTQFFRMRVRDSDSKLWIFNKINQVFKWLMEKEIWSEKIVNFFYQVIDFVFFGSWRFSLFYTNKGLRFKFLFTNKYHRAGTLPHPAAFREWQKRELSMRVGLIEQIEILNELRPRIRRALVG